MKSGFTEIQVNSVVKIEGFKILYLDFICNCIFQEKKLRTFSVMTRFAADLPCYCG